MLAKYSVFNMTLLNEVTKIIKQKVKPMNLTKAIQITTSHKPHYINTVPLFEKEENLIKEVDLLIEDVLTDIKSQTNNAMQQTYPLSSKAKEFLQQLDEVMSRDFISDNTSFINNKLSNNISDEPLLKGAFSHREKTNQEKYIKMIDKH